MSFQIFKTLEKLKQKVIVELLWNRKSWIIIINELSIHSNFNYILLIATDKSAMFEFVDWDDTKLSIVCAHCQLHEFYLVNGFGFFFEMLLKISSRFIADTHRLWSTADSIYDHNWSKVFKD